MRVGLIVGTGMGDLFPGLQWSTHRTEYGTACVALTAVDGTEIIVLRRHGLEMRTPPHLINYRANIQALRDNDATRAVSTAAVGSLRLQTAPGTLAIVEDFIDCTRSGPITIFDSPTTGLVHTDFSRPFCPEVSEALSRAASKVCKKRLPKVVYVGVDGPRYESPAEVRMYAKFGGDVVGMTVVREAILAREMGICYGCLAIVANYASGLCDKPLRHEEVTQLTRARENDIRAIICETIRRLPRTNQCTCKDGSCC